MEISMLINNKCFKWWGWKYLPMRGKDIIAVCSHMDKQEQGNRIRWWGTVQIKYTDIKKGHRTNIMLIDI
jgi:hypothetical protein